MKTNRDLYRCSRIRRAFYFLPLFACFFYLLARFAFLCFFLVFRKRPFAEPSRPHLRKEQAEEDNEAEEADEVRRGQRGVHAALHHVRRENNRAVEVHHQKHGKHEAQRDPAQEDAVVHRDIQPLVDRLHLARFHPALGVDEEAAELDEQEEAEVEGRAAAVGVPAEDVVEEGDRRGHVVREEDAVQRHAKVDDNEGVDGEVGGGERHDAADAHGHVVLRQQIRVLRPARLREGPRERDAHDGGVDRRVHPRAPVRLLSQRQIDVDLVDVRGAAGVGWRRKEFVRDDEAGDEQDAAPGEDPAVQHHALVGVDVLERRRSVVRGKKLLLMMRKIVFIAHWKLFFFFFWVLNNSCIDYCCCCRCFK